MNAQVRRPLFRKYVALFVAVVSVALLINGGLEVWFSYQEHKASLIRIQREQAEAAAAKIGQFVKEIESQIGWTTQLPWSASTIEQRRFDGLRLLRQVPAITELSMVDATGKEQLRVSRLAMDVVGSGTDLSKEPKFAEAATRKVYYGPVYFRRESEPYMTLSLAGTRRDSGVSIAEVNLKLIWEVISKIKVGERGHAYVIDSGGRLIAHPDISLVLRNTDMSGLPQVKAASAGTAEPIRETKNTQGKDVLAASAPVPPLGWHVLAELPVDEAYAPLYGSMQRTGLVMFGALFAAALSGMLLARRMVGPIRTLREGAARLGGGDLGQRIEVRTGDEVEALASEFNVMADRLQESYADLEKKVEIRTRELSEALARQTATAEVLQAISRSTFDLETVLNTLVESAAGLCEADIASITKQKDGRFYRTAIHGMPEDFAEKMRAIPVEPDRGTVTGRALLEGTTVHIEDVTRDPDYTWSEAQRAGGVHTLMGVPLLRDGVPIGAMALGRKEARPFTDKQIELVSTFADQAVIAIENARLFDEVQARTRDLQESLEYQTATGEVLNVISRSPSEVRPVFDSIVATAQRLCQADFAYVFQSKESGLYRLVASNNATSEWVKFREDNPISPGDTSVMGRALLEQRVVHVPDVTEESDKSPTRVEAHRLGRIRTALAAPLIQEGSAVGVIGLARTERRPFSERQVALLATFADQALIAINNARLFAELQARTHELARSVSELQALGEVTRAVNSTLDLEKVLDTIVAKAVQLSGTDAGAIYVYSGQRREYRLRATYGMDEDLVRAVRRQTGHLGSTSVRDAVARREPVQVPDLHDEPSSPIRDLVLQAGYRAVLIVPLLRPDQVLGALVVRRREPGEFDDATKKLLMTFAEQSVLAIQNARLFSEIEEKGRQLELASRHKSQFLANMSHELRTPLNSVLGFTEMMADGLYGALPEKARNALVKVQANGKHLLGLINDVLDLSKIEAGQLTLSLDDYSVGQLVGSVVAGTEPLARAKGLELAASVPPALPIGRGDERRLTQVVINLVGNAIKFTDSGSVEIVGRSVEGFFEIDVRDTGPGIEPEDQKKIFEEFQQVDDSSTRKKGGTGLGLAISRRIVELHGGTLTVQSAPGEGSTFRVRVPIRVEQAREAA